MIFIYPIIIGIIIGYLFGGKLISLGNIKLNGINYIFAGFIIDAFMQLLGRFHILSIGKLTFGIDLIMYILIVIFVFKNIKNIYAILLGLGSILNAIAIFTNGGAMPVRKSAMDAIFKNYVPSRAGLYEAMSGKAHFKSLSDIIYVKILGPSIFSVGDIIIAFAIMLLIITGMQNEQSLSKRILNRNKRQRRTKRQQTELEIN